MIVRNLIPRTVEELETFFCIILLKSEKLSSIALHLKQTLLKELRVSGPESICPITPKKPAPEQKPSYMASVQSLKKRPLGRATTGPGQTQTTMTREEDLFRIAKKLDKMVSRSNMDGALDLLQELKGFNMTLKLLQNTRIGMSVNAIRKHCTDEQVISLAKFLIKNWKRLLESGQTPKEEKLYDGKNGAESSTLPHKKNHCAPPETESELNGSPTNTTPEMERALVKTASEIVAASSKNAPEMERVPSKITGEKERVPSKITGEKERVSSKIMLEKERFSSKITGEKERVTSKITGEKERVPSKVTAEKERIPVKITGEKEIVPSKITVEKERVSSKIMLEKERVSSKVTVGKEGVSSKITMEKERVPTKSTMEERVSTKIFPEEVPSHKRSCGDTRQSAESLRKLSAEHRKERHSAEHKAEKERKESSDSRPCHVTKRLSSDGKSERRDVELTPASSPPAKKLCGDSSRRDSLGSKTPNPGLPQRKSSTDSVSGKEKPDPPKTPISPLTPPFSPAGGPLPPYLLTGDSIRDKCIEMLSAALRTDDDYKDYGTNCDSMAAEIEDYILYEIKATDMKYKNRVRSRISNLKDPKNPGLRKNVLAGSIELQRIASMTAEEMASDELKQLRSTLTLEAIREHQMAKTGGTTTDLLQCAKCKKKNCTYNQVQTRSADEPMTTFVLCNECGNRWKFC
ncbi:hypothetical protein GJAV_G00009590 [Gymnothorax javanicus]|nr:hypothetical protein GJAV_G00009590 [Gymnothorax javanicus]